MIEAVTRQMLAAPASSDDGATSGISAVHAVLGATLMQVAAFEASDTRAAIDCDPRELEKLEHRSEKVTLAAPRPAFSTETLRLELNSGCCGAALEDDTTQPELLPSAQKVLAGGCKPLDHAPRGCRSEGSSGACAHGSTGSRIGWLAKSRLLPTELEHWFGSVGGSTVTWMA